MSLRKLASSVAFCCARAPTKVSNAPTMASPTYSSHRHRSAFLWLTPSTDAVIPYLLGNVGWGCPKACRITYSHWRGFCKTLICSYLFFAFFLFTLLSEIFPFPPLLVALWARTR